jgi:hypothetical protein
LVAPKRKKEETFDLIGESITCSEGSDDGLFLTAIVQLAARFRVLELMKVLIRAASSYQYDAILCAIKVKRALNIAIRGAIKVKRAIVGTIRVQ